MQKSYGFEDATYQAVGGLDGLIKLVDDFYAAMETLPEAAKVRAMHTEDLTMSRDKLVCFLSGWMGGPSIYAEKYGPVVIPLAHKHIVIDEEDRDVWLLCMQTALDKQGYPQALKRYLMEQLYVPAERIRQVSRMTHGAS